MPATPVSSIDDVNIKWRGFDREELGQIEHYTFEVEEWVLWFEVANRYLPDHAGNDVCIKNFGFQDQYRLARRVAFLPETAAAIEKIIVTYFAGPWLKSFGLDRPRGNVVTTVTFDPNWISIFSEP